MLNTASGSRRVGLLTVGGDGAAFVASSSAAASSAKQIGLDAMRRVDSKLDRKMMVQLFRERKNENVLRTSSPSLPSSFSWLLFMKDWAGARAQADRASPSVGR